MGGGEADQKEGQASKEVSDLIGAELTVAVMVWLLLVFAAFFFVGPVVGVIVLAGGVIGFGWVFVSAIRRADTPD